MHDMFYFTEGLRQNQTYRLRVAANTVNGTGPYSKWRSVVLAGEQNGETGMNYYVCDFSMSFENTPSVFSV